MSFGLSESDKAAEAGNRVPKQEFNDMLLKEGWEADVNTVFTFVDGEFNVIERNDDIL